MKKVLYMGYVWPERTQSAAGVRTWQLIEYFKSRGYDVYFNSGAVFTDEHNRLQDFGVQTSNFKVNEPGFEEWIGQLAPDFVFFDRYVIEEQFGWQVQNACPKAIRVIDTQDFHTLREFRKQKIQTSILEVPNLLRELASYLRSDAVVLISDSEQAILKNELQYPVSNLVTIPFMYDWKDSVSEFYRKITLAERSHFVFIGNFLHEPNVDAVRFLYEKLWPKIFQKLKQQGIQAEVHIYGASIPKMISEFHQPDKGFQVMGWAKDQYEILSRYRVLLAPLRFGAGLKGKIADSWYSGTSVVSTSIGLEGYGGEVLNFSASSDEDFIEKSIRAYTDLNWSHESLQVGQITLKNQMSHSAVHSKLDRWLAELSANYLASRQRNWLGRILWREGLRSTEYFSKWIQEKNRQKTH